MLKEGDPAPDFELLDQDGTLVQLSSFKGQKLVVSFYPKDNTPGCTTEAKNFRDSIADYDSAGIKIIGISKNSVASHKKFVDKYNLPFTLLADTKLVAAKAFGAFTAGKVKRRTWVIEEDWTIERVYEKVSLTNHNAELCAVLIKR